MKKNKIYKNGFYSFLEFLLGPISSVLMAPIILKCLGTEIFGVWLLAIAVANMSQMLSLGTSLGLISFVASDLSKADKTSSVLICRASITIVCVNYCAIIIFVVFGYEYVSRFLYNSIVNPQIVFVSITYSLLHMLIQELDSILGAHLKGRGDFLLNTNLELCGKLIWISMILSATVYWKNIYYLYAAGIVSLVIKLGIKSYLLCRITKDYFILVPTVNKKALVRILKFGQWQILQVLGAILFGTVDKFLVSNMFGITVMSKYVLCTQLAQSVHSAQSSMWMALYQWIGEKKIMLKKNNKNLVRIAIYGGLFSIIAPLMIALISKSLLKIWLGAEFSDENNILFKIIMLSYVFISFTIPSHYILLAYDYNKYCSLIVLIAGFLVVAVQYLLVDFGIEFFSASKYIFILTLAPYLIAVKKIKP